MLQWNDHYNDCWTEREKYFHNDPEGVLVYNSGEGTTVERTDEGVRVKVVLPKRLNWMQLADQLMCEVTVMARWASDEMRGGKRTLAELAEVERDPEQERRWQELSDTDNDPYLYLYFYDDKHWVMYENDEEYLFVFDLTTDNAFMGSTGLDALHFTPKDCLGYLYSWLQRWYDRVNGYEEMA